MSFRLSPWYWPTRSRILPLPRAILSALWIVAAASIVRAADPHPTADKPAIRLATFSADVTIPLGHRCMGVLPVKAREIVDPLYAHGFVLEGAGDPLVLVAVDWCEIRNGAYDRWRDVLARAASTSRERVLVSSLHQHDAPVVDSGAEELLAEVELAGELFDVKFHEEAVQRVAASLRESLKSARAVTHFGAGQARVEKVASNRRVVHPDGRVTFSRGSSSGGDRFHREAPVGLIDPWLKTFSFWDGGKPLLALHAYATHPMSYYGRGGVSADFVGMARDRRQRDDPAVAQIYVSGCSGDVTAGKYNDGSPANRPILANRLYEAMKLAWKNTRRLPLQTVTFRNTSFALDFHEGAAFTVQALTRTLEDKTAKVTDRVLAAMGLSTRRRLGRGHRIDMPCIDFGEAQILLFPGESFVGYQLLAQRMRPDSFVVSIGYGECWPGYIPTRAAFEDKFGHGWRWVAPGVEARIKAALERVLGIEADG